MASGHSHPERQARLGSSPKPEDSAWTSARASARAGTFAPWADFRSYMDLSLARALHELRAACHGGSATPVGIEGTQMPHAFGGYDSWRLSPMRWIGWSPMTSAMPAKSSAPSCRAGQSSQRSLRRKTTRPGGGCGICCWKATGAASSGGVKIASTGRALTIR